MAGSENAIRDGLAGGGVWFLAQTWPQYYRCLANTNNNNSKKFNTKNSHAII